MTTATVDLTAWRATVADVVSRVKYRDDYRFVTEQEEDGRVYVQLLHYREDAMAPGQFAWGKGGRVYVEPGAGVGAILRRLFGAALAYEEHEVREFFRWSPSVGAEHRPVFGPHLDVRALWSVADQLDV